MAHVRADVIQIIWEQLDEYSWENFRQVLNEFYFSSNDDTTGINAHTIDTLTDMTRHMEYNRVTFPQSAQRLYEVINANFGFEKDLQKGI